MNFVECVRSFGPCVIVVKNWALLPVVKVRIPELPLPSAWLDYSITSGKACEALSPEPRTQCTEWALTTLSLLLILDCKSMQLF